MRTLILIGIALLPCALSGLAQRRLPRESDISREEREANSIRKRNNELMHLSDKIAITWERDALHQVVFTVHNNAFCNYVVELSFSDLQNFRPDVNVPYKMDVPPGSRRMLSLSIVTKGAPTHFAYHHRTFKGFLSHEKVDTSYAYLLPVPPGRETHIYELNYLASEFGNAPEPKGWYALSMHVHSGDTIYAARRGRVTETKDDANLQDTSITYAREENYIEIAHNDGSFGVYKVFRDSSLFVHPGDYVEAGQPIGIAGGDKYAGGPQVRFEVFYHLEQEVQVSGEDNPRMLYRAYVPLRFWVKDKGATQLVNHSKYISEHPSELITKEMSKKEAAKWASAHQPG